MATADFEANSDVFEEEEETHLFSSVPPSLQSPARAHACFSQARPPTHVLVAIVLCSFIAIFTGSWWYLSPSDLRSPPSAAVQDCGTSAAEALARGCQFDAMSFSWLPPACFDAPLMQDFLRQRDWQWFLDPAGQQAVPSARALTGEYDKLYVTREYHLLHCLYMWRKMHRAVLFGEGRGAVDGYIANIAHTEHCGRMLLHQPPHAIDSSDGLQVVDTYIFVKFVLCGPAVWADGDKEGGRRPGWYRVVGGEKVFTIPEGP